MRCGNLDYRCMRLLLVFASTGKLDPGRNIPNQCRKFEVLSS